MCDVDLEPCSVWEETTRKARKEHVCTSCGAIIHPGEKYVATFSVLEDERRQDKSCPPCAEAIKQFGATHDMTPLPHCFDSVLEGCIDEGDEESETVWKPILEALRARKARSVTDSQRSVTDGER